MTKKDGYDFQERQHWTCKTRMNLFVFPVYGAMLLGLMASTSYASEAAASPSPGVTIGGPHSAWVDITLKLLDWPFLLSVVIMAVVCSFRQQLIGLFSRGDILISWGEGRSIRLRDLADKIDEEIDPLRDEVESLRETAPKTPVAANLPGAGSGVESAQRRSEALRVMKEALANPRFRWRAIDRLAAIAYIPESEAAELLHSDPDVVYSIGKSRKPIARLKAR